MSLKAKPPKERRCKHCEAWFLPPRHMMPFCSPMCETIFKGQAPKKAKKKQARLAKIAHNRSDVKKQTAVAKKVMQEYARLRDIDEPCESCRKPTAAQWDGGHYMNAENFSQVRFNLWNINKQCSHCNKELGSNAIEYRKHLIIKIGLEKVEQLENSKAVVKYSAEYLTRLIKVFRKKIRMLKKRHAQR